MRILKDFQFLHFWTLEQTNDDITVIIDCPSTFNPDSIEIKYDEESRGVTIFVENQLPFVNGLLFAEIDSHVVLFDSSVVSIIFKKKQNSLWPLFIVNINPTTNNIDPHSAYDIFLFYCNQNEQIFSDDEAQLFLTKSLESGYVPAMLFSIEQLENTEEDFVSALPILEQAARYYMNVTAMLKLALYNNRFEDKREEAFKLFMQASKQGSIIALSFLGQILSPTSGIAYHEKDAETALRLFNQVIEKNEEPIALYEASKLLKSDHLGIPDIERAKDLYQRALVQEPQLPPLEFEEDKMSVLPIVLGVSAVIAGIIWWRSRKNKK